MNITFLRNKDGSPRGLVYISSTGTAKTVSKDSCNWAKIEAAIRDNDEDALMNAISMKRSVENFGNTGKIQVRNGAVYYGGEKLFGEDVNRIFSYLHGGFPTASMIKFLEAKVRNVSPESVVSLYSFLENKGMPITDRGTILGYRGVESDYYSKTSGSEPLISGKRDERGKILNAIGETIWMDRCYVCANNNEGCAGGLHIGSKDYATSWAGNGGKVMIAEFSPEFVVSVPATEHQKLRVSKYKIVGELNGEVLGDVYNGDYARPDESPNPDEDEFSDDTKVAGITPEIVTSKNIYNISDWSRGQATGYKDGKGHQKRKFYEEDRGNSFKKYSKEFITGYLVGYLDGRK